MWIWQKSWITKQTKLGNIFGLALRVSNRPKWSQRVTNCTKIVPKWSQMVSNCPKWVSWYALRPCFFRLLCWKPRKRRIKESCYQVLRPLWKVSIRWGENNDVRWYVLTTPLPPPVCHLPGAVHLPSLPQLWPHLLLAVPGQGDSSPRLLGSYSPTHLHKWRRICGRTRGDLGTCPQCRVLVAHENRWLALCVCVLI